MKRVKCHRDIYAIKVGPGSNDIVKLQGPDIKDKTIDVPDNVATKLLAQKGFELIKDLSMDEPNKVDLSKYNRTFKKSWLDKLKSLFTGGKKR